MLQPEKSTHNLRNLSYKFVTCCFIEIKKILQKEFQYNFRCFFLGVGNFFVQFIRNNCGCNGHLRTPVTDLPEL